MNLPKNGIFATFFSLIFPSDIPSTLPSENRFVAFFLQMVKHVKEALNSHQYWYFLSHSVHLLYVVLINQIFHFKCLFLLVKSFTFNFILLIFNFCLQAPFCSSLSVYRYFSHLMTVGNHIFPLPDNLQFPVEIFPLVPFFFFLILQCVFFLSLWNSLYYTLDLAFLLQFLHPVTCCLTHSS